MPGSGRVTIKKLSEEIDALKVKLEGMDSLQKRVDDLENSLEIIKRQRSECSNDLHRCKTCDEVFSNVVDLKKHQHSIHGAQFTKCIYCTKTFSKNNELEVHLALEHKEIEKFKCESCNKTFVLKWRLKKHQSMHIENKPSMRFCHYHNNDKICPFADIGCMFRHEIAPPCKYQKCFKRLCQFKHLEVIDVEHSQPVERKKSDEESDCSQAFNKNVTSHSNDIPKEELIDDEGFELYVDNCFSEIYRQYVTGKKELTCYYCSYISKSKTLMSIQTELSDHIKHNHSDIIDSFDPDTFIFDNDLHEEFLLLFAQE